MAWLLRKGEVLASLEVADSMAARARGMLGRDADCEALFCAPAKAAHTLGVRFPVDVAFLDADYVVFATTCLEPFRVGLPRPRTRAILQARAGAFERWSLQLGDHLEIRT